MLSLEAQCFVNVDIHICFDPPVAFLMSLALEILACMFTRICGQQIFIMAMHLPRNDLRQCKCPSSRGFSE